MTSFADMPPEASDLVIQLMQASQAQTAGITTSVIDSLTEQLADSRAEVSAIRNRIDALFAGPYMPTPDAVLAALWPDADDRERFRRDKDMH